MRSLARLPLRVAQILRSEGLATLIERAYGRFEELTRPAASVVVRDVPLPEWIDSEGAPVAVRNEERPYPEYFNVVDGQSTDIPVTLDPPWPVDLLELDVVGTQWADELTVTADMAAVDGERITRSKTFVTGDFNDSNRLSLAFSADDPIERATLRISESRRSHSGGSTDNRAAAYLRRLRNPNEITGPRLSLPAARRMDGSEPPIFLISVDTFRHDYLDTFDPLVEALGPDAVVPTEPRTHAEMTRPAHGSLFTGTYPGEHGYTSASNRPMDPSLTTIPMLLADAGYKCSACVPNTNLLPDWGGFGKGFHRFVFTDMMESWMPREYDARRNLDTLLGWLEQDVSYSSNGLFYFLGVLDPHYPYVPPDPLRRYGSLDLSMLDDYRQVVDQSPNPEVETDYVYNVEESPTADGIDLDTLQSYYAQSLEYVADQLVRLVDDLRRRNILEESFIIVTGDHGEEFFERGFGFHRSLYDANIRPGMVVKPPGARSFTVPDDPDLIDVLPTIAHLVGRDSPEQCAGRPWQEQRTARPRIAERIEVDYYTISVEIDGVKGLFTYESNGGERPTGDQLDDGPVKTEYYEIDAVRAGEFDDHSDRIAPELKRRIEETAAGIMRRNVDRTDAGWEFEIAPDTRERLERLGYK